MQGLARPTNVASIEGIGAQCRPVVPLGRNHVFTGRCAASAQSRGWRISAAAVDSNGSSSQGIITAAPPKPLYTNANMPVDEAGRTYHLNTKSGEVANRILSVGSSQRAKLLSKLLDPPAPGKPPFFTKMSSRGFMTITGRYKGVPVTIISTHMGLPNMDFVVRECRAVVKGQMAILRLGTCGATQPPAKLGDMLLASSGSIAIRRNPDAWSAPAAGHARYTVSLPVLPDPTLCAIAIEEVEKEFGADRVVQGLNASADSFYSSQGRINSDFDDGNDSLLQQLCTNHPDLISLEMETFQLLDLARCAKGGSLLGMSMCIALAERYSNRFLDYKALEVCELAGGRAALSALVRMQLANDASLEAGSVDPMIIPVWA